MGFGILHSTRLLRSSLLKITQEPKRIFKSSPRKTLEHFEETVLQAGGIFNSEIITRVLGLFSAENERIEKLPSSLLFRWWFLAITERAYGQNLDSDDYLENDEIQTSFELPSPLLTVALPNLVRHDFFTMAKETFIVENALFKPDVIGKMLIETGKNDKGQKLLLASELVTGKLLFEKTTENVVYQILKQNSSHASLCKAKEFTSVFLEGNKASHHWIELINHDLSTITTCSTFDFSFQSGAGSNKTASNGIATMIAREVASKINDFENSNDSVVNACAMGVTKCYEFLSALTDGSSILQLRELILTLSTRIAEVDSKSMIPINELQKLSVIPKRDISFKMHNNALRISLATHNILATRYHLRTLLKQWGRKALSRSVSLKVSRWCKKIMASNDPRRCIAKDCLDILNENMISLEPRRDLMLVSTQQGQTYNINEKKNEKLLSMSISDLDTAAQVLLSTGRWKMALSVIERIKRTPRESAKTVEEGVLLHSLHSLGNDWKSALDFFK